MSSCCLSVSPLLCPNTTASAPVDKHDQEEEHVEAEVRTLKEWAVLSEPIVGVEVVTLDERGQGALPPQALPAPKEPTPAVRARHNLTHMRYES